MNLKERIEYSDRVHAWLDGRSEERPEGAPDRWDGWAEHRRKAIERLKRGRSDDLVLVGATPLYGITADDVMYALRYRRKWEVAGEINWATCVYSGLVVYRESNIFRDDTPAPAVAAPACACGKPLGYGVKAVGTRERCADCYLKEQPQDASRMALTRPPALPEIRKRTTKQQLELERRFGPRSCDYWPTVEDEP